MMTNYKRSKHVALLNIKNVLVSAISYIILRINININKIAMLEHVSKPYL
jgi:hypothetical protein